MNRQDFQTLAEIRVEDARALLDAGQYAGAYYLCGYAIECGLKACIAKQTVEHEFPNLNRVRQSYTHDLRQLIVRAELERELDIQRRVSVDFNTHWGILEGWSEQSRYDHDITIGQARDLFYAVTDSNYGVLPWLRNFW
jgi:HEPN domain-containing protein